jgi:hypothetical protein
VKLLGRLFVALLLLGNLLLLGGLSVHVVRSPGKAPAVIAKDHLTLVDTYVDTTSWTAADVTNHSNTVTRIVQAGKADCLAHVPGQVSSAAQAGHPQPAQPQRDASARKAAAEEPHNPSIFDFDKK